jgi:hypothetical protein
MQPKLMPWLSRGTGFPTTSPNHWLAQSQQPISMYVSSEKKDKELHTRIISSDFHNRTLTSP